MDELIKITEKDGIKTVDARDLHRFLVVGRDFASWIKGRIDKYGFINNVDFTLESRSPVPGSGNRGASKEYFLTLEMAKELSMVENNEKGKQARRYFIDVEKRARELSDSLSGDPIISMRLKQIEIERRMNSLEADWNMIKPLPGFFTVLAYCKKNKIRIDNATAGKIGRKASALCHENGITPGVVTDTRFGTVKAYPEEIIDIAVESL